MRRSSQGGPTVRHGRQMSDAATPGWYHAEGDPPETERYWDGTTWTEGPRPIGGVPDAPSADMPAADAPSTDMPETDMPDTSGFSTTTPDSATPGSATTQFGAPYQGSPQDGFSAPRAAPGGTPVQGGFPGAPVGGAVGAAGFFPEQSQAQTALIVSIVGGILCGLPGLVGAFMGNRERKAIAAGQRDPANQGKATAAIVIGLLFGLFGLLILFLILVSVVAVGLGA